ncbi:hypothetical protein CCP4SC76_1890009 [Gammaproteobacteria bacterium]
MRLMERKFGPLDEETRARIHGADAETLLTWGEQVLTASRVEAIFGEPGGHLEGAP